jgi:hypothetical protein
VPVIALCADHEGPFGMEMQHFRYFVSLCETLDFSRAANTCNMLEGFKWSRRENLVLS